MAAALVGVVAALAFLCAWQISRRGRQSRRGELDPAGDVLRLRGLPYFGTISFVFSPYTFLSRARSVLGDTWIRFSLCQREIVVPTGAAARALVFGDKDFSFLQGYSILGPSFQSLAMKPKHANHDSAGHFLRQFSRTDAIQSFIGPTLVGLVHFTSRWGTSGSFDLVNEFADLVFQMSLRIALGNDIAADPSTVRYAVTAYRWMNQSATPDGMVLPFIPTPKRIRCILAGMRLYNLVKKAIAVRKHDGKPRVDVLQSLLDEDMDLMDCMKLTSMVSLSAGMTTSGVLTWLHIYLCVYPEWKAKVVEEITQFQNEHCLDAGDFGGLADVSVGQWEDGLPLLQRCIQETIRLVSIGALPRRNMGGDKVIGEQVIRSGEFVLLMTEDANMDPNVYHDPRTFHPDRDTSIHPLTALGFGSGNYACPGQRFALCMLKVFTLALLSKYAFELVDKAGNPVTVVPGIDRELFSIGIPAQKLRVQYKMRPVPRRA